MKLLPRVTNEIERVKESFPTTQVTVQPDGSIHIEIPNVPLPPGWNKSEATILIIVPIGYPQARPDGFYADSDLRAQNGAKVPDGSGQVQIAGRNWTRFCWQPTTWDMSRDNLWKYVKLALSRFKENR